jgi:hypothetical protein
MFQSMLRDLVDGPAKAVWVRLGLPPDDIENLWLSEAPDPSVNSSFKLGTAAQVRTYDQLLGMLFLGVSIQLAFPISPRTRCS